MADVEVFYSQMCGLCHKAMDFFRERGVPFTAHEVEWAGTDWKDTHAARLMRERCGKVDFVPQILVRGKHIEGWRTLEPMIDSGEILKLLED